MSKNPLFCNGEENEKVIWNPQTDLDHHQKLMTSGGSPIAMPASLVDVHFHLRQFTE